MRDAAAALAFYEHLKPRILLKFMQARAGKSVIVLTKTENSVRFCFEKKLLYRFYLFYQPKYGGILKKTGKTGRFSYSLV